ncbi:MAG: S9 family peptidase [Rudaea sp.]|uniref:S9 family peptidase n=1 Tax=Rudaea sp. TaxID=2136325 RepID=UPI0039E6A925
MSAIPFSGIRFSAVPLLAGLLLAGCAVPPREAPPPAPQPPVAAVHPYAVPSPNGTRIDNYYWLRDDTRSKPEVLNYLKAENAYYAQMTQHTQGLQDALYREITARIAPDDASVPVKYRHCRYQTRYAQGAEYPVSVRRCGSVDASEQILLDGPELAHGHGFFQIRGYEVSPGEKLIAWADDTAGRLQFTIRFKDLASGKTLPDELKNTSGAMAWADDNRTLFYVENDPVTLLTVRVKKHVLGTDAKRDPVVYEERDHSYYLDLERTRDDKFIAIQSHSTLSSEIRFIPASQPKARFKVLAPREHDFEYHAAHIDRRWVIRTNWQAKNYRVMQVDDAAVGDRKRWHEIVPARGDATIDDIAVFRDYLVVGEHSEGLARVRIKPWRAGASHLVEVDEADYAATIGDNRETDTDVLRYEVTSLVTPKTVYDLDMRTGKREERKRDAVVGYDAANYATERVWAVARDGTKIPVSIAYRKDTKRDGTAPMFQIGYGAYGAQYDPHFSPAYVSLLDRGFVVAIAHIRGGGEMGRAWYEDGKLLKKKNTFTDFIDTTEYLVAQKIAAKDKVFAFGRSAGGLLMGAVANMAPQDYRGIFAQVPFVDVVTTMLDDSIPLTTNEFDEWGNPQDTKFYKTMLAYSPYDNVKAQAYPAMFVSTGLNDSQVQYYEPAKWVAKLRATKTDANPLLFKINMEAGHGGQSGRYTHWRETAEAYAFLLDQLPSATATRAKK